ncbi:MAG: peptidoglycan DD-metalloendopeptidase family protein [Sphingomonadales bacterium]|nr:peptidoglycan DD-metalloendopeptidase family protein [Sphingomonadales bacterium]
MPLRTRLFLAAAALLCAGAAAAQVYSDAGDARHALAEAQAAGAQARARAEKLEAEAAGATQAVERTVREAAAVAARIQQDEADIAAAEARVRLIDGQRAQLRASLAERQRPLVRLTAALQRLSRRPLAIALLRPGSLADAVHTRALIETMIPEVHRRTAALRVQIARGIALQHQARAAQGALRAQQRQLAARQQELVGLETRQRLAARDVSGSADREAERALALAEQARDLGALADTLGEADSLRAELAALPGPVLRPDHPGGGAAPSVIVPSPEPTAPRRYQLPAAGRLVSGFGDAASGSISRGIRLAVRPGAQVVSPGNGRIAFAGPYRGYGDIVIVAHEGKWTSLITGLARLDAQVGDSVVAGSPLGVAGPGQPVLGLELRHAGVPVNPLEPIGRR